MSRLTRFPLAAVLAASVSLMAACGGSGQDDSSPATEPAATGTTMSADETPDPGRSHTTGTTDVAKPGIGITTGESQFGEILFDEDDRAIYYFDKEKTVESECYGACAAAWPPVLTEGRPVARRGARDALLGTTERRDGSTQVTYDGRPLYYYVDEPPGQVLCHNVDEFGGLWLVIRPDGAPVP